LQQACADLGGQLSVFYHPVRMLETIWRDAYSPHIFAMILGLPGEKLLRDVPPDSPPHETVQALTSELHGNAAMYYIARYEKATRLMAEFVRLAARAYKALADDDLISLGQGSTADADRTESRTEAMHVLLSAAKVRLPAEEFAALARLVDKIGEAVSKEHAAAELERRPWSRAGGAEP
jgi:hypothetical protein